MEETDNFILVQEKDLEYGGVIVFNNNDGISDFRVHIFFCLDVFTGQPPGTEVMINPTWFDLERLDQLDMMPADKFFLPIILKDKKIIRGRAILEKGFKCVKEFSCEEISLREAEILLKEVQK